MEWRDTEFPGYQVSDTGEVVGRRGRKLTSSINGYGYLRVAISGYGSRSVHYLVCTAFNGDRPGHGYWIRHLDGNKLNNRPDNLEWRAPTSGDSRGGIVSCYLNSWQYAALTAMVDQSGVSRSAVLKRIVSQALKEEGYL